MVGDHVHLNRVRLRNHVYLGRLHVGNIGVLAVDQYLYTAKGSRQPTIRYGSTPIGGCVGKVLTVNGDEVPGEIGGLEVAAFTTPDAVMDASEETEVPAAA
jgi:hypothetical protein